MVDHLLNRKIDHWDIVIRELTAKALHNLTSKCMEYMVSTVLPTLFKKTTSIDLNSRHGAVLAIGEIIYALSKLPKDQTIEDVLNMREIENLIPEFRKKFYFRGLGGELMRSACCYFIEKCSLAALELKTEITSNK